MNLIIVLPIIIPLLFAVSMLFFWKNVRVHKILNVIASIFSLVVAGLLLSDVNSSGILSLQVGSWQAPFGISLVADLLSSIMVLITAVIGLATSIYSLGSMDEQREKFLYYPLLQFLLMGINGAFLTGDIFNLYVWFEVMLISSFVLFALGGKREQLRRRNKICYFEPSLISNFSCCSWNTLRNCRYTQYGRPRKKNSIG